MLSATASTVIHAPAACIWQIVTDLERYADWNPNVVVARGTLRSIDQLQLGLTGPLAHCRSAVVLDVRRHQLYSWLLCAPAGAPQELQDYPDALVFELEIAQAQAGGFIVIQRLSGPETSCVWRDSRAAVTRWLAVSAAALQDRVQDSLPPMSRQIDGAIRISSRHGLRHQIARRHTGVLLSVAAAASEAQRALAA